MAPVLEVSSGVHGEMEGLCGGRQTEKCVREREQQDKANNRVMTFSLSVIYSSLIHLFIGLFIHFYVFNLKFLFILQSQINLCVFSVFCKQFTLISITFSFMGSLYKFHLSLIVSTVFAGGVWDEVECPYS